MAEACYFCGEPSVSEDHCPPKVFFPERKDLAPDVPDLRLNLVTNPSCRRHNEDYAKDDEYVAFVIAHLAANNAVGEQHVITKVLRAINRNPRLVPVLYPNPRIVQTPEGETMAFTADIERMKRVMDRITRGLYFHHTRRTLPSEPTLWKFLGLRDAETQELDPRHERLLEAANEIVRSGGVPVLAGFVGSPLVFQYEMIGGPERGLYRLRFYEGFVAIGAHRTKSGT